MYCSISRCYESQSLEQTSEMNMHGEVSGTGLEPSQFD